jgi:hypothetical protein
MKVELVSVGEQSFFQRQGGKGLSMREISCTEREAPEQDEP